MLLSVMSILAQGLVLLLKRGLPRLPDLEVCEICIHHLLRYNTDVRNESV